MADPAPEHVPEELEAIVRRLRSDRATADPLRLDQIKQQVLARRRSNMPVFTALRSRLATVATIFALVGGTGGAIALAGTNSSNGPSGGAASGQYKPGKGCGDKNHQHQGKKKPCPKPKHGKGKSKHGKGKSTGGKGKSKGGKGKGKSKGGKGKHHG